MRTVRLATASILIDEQPSYPSQCLARCLEMIDKGVPREHYAVVIDGLHGHVTTGMLAPTVEVYAAMAIVPAEKARIGGEAEVIIRDQPKKAKIVRRPFYIPAFRR